VNDTRDAWYLNHQRKYKEFKKKYYENKSLYQGERAEEFMYSSDEN